MSIALVTDSTADIPGELTQMHQIHVVPNLVIIDGQSLEDGRGISRKEFYERLPTMKSTPTTATASIGAYQTLYERLFSQGASYIISIHASSLLSGIFNAASAAAQAFEERVKVIDSEHISLGLGFQVLAAAEEIRQEQPLETILTWIADIRRRIRVVAMLDTLEYVRRSGRVSWARARIGDFLRVKPFLEVREGQVFSLGESRTRRKGVEHLKKILQKLGALERLAVLHTNAEKDANQFLDSLKVKLPQAPLFVNVTTVIGTHVGPNGLGFAAVIK
ncbi:DegV family protein [Chloroflexota bacterium]